MDLGIIEQHAIEFEKYGAYEKCGAQLTFWVAVVKSWKLLICNPCIRHQIC